MFLGLFFGGSIIDSLICLVVGGGISWILITILDALYSMVKRYINTEKTTELELLWKEREIKNDIRT